VAGAGLAYMRETWIAQDMSLPVVWSAC
jgi:hypothetical protein